MAFLEASSGRTATLRVASERDSAPRVVVHATLAELDSLAGPWSALAADAGGRGPFLGFDWNRAWAELFCGETRRLHVLAVRRGSELLGIAPWLVYEPRRWFEPRRIAFLGAELTAWDHLDVICAPGEERVVAAALYAHLFGASAPRWQRLELHGVRADSAFLFHLRECFEQDGKHIEARAGAFCPTRSLEGGGLLGSLTARRQKRLRYEQQVLERAGSLEHETRTQRDAEFPEALASLAALYRKRWGGDPDALRCVEAYARLAGPAHGLRVDLLRVAGRTLGGLLQLRRDDTLYLYLLAIDREPFPKRSVGDVLIGLALERAGAEGVRCYDFLRGGEDYKLQWSDGAVRNLDFTAYRPGAVVLAQLALARARELVKVAWR